MSTKYILINANFDNCEVDKKRLENIEELELEFEGDEDILQDLLRDGVYDWEWGEWHLITVEDFE